MNDLGILVGLSSENYEYLKDYNVKNDQIILVKLSSENCKYFEGYNDKKQLK